MLGELRTTGHNNLHQVKALRDYLEPADITTSKGERVDLLDLDRTEQDTARPGV